MCLMSRLLKSYEKINDSIGVDKTKRELIERRVKIDLKTGILEEMMERKQEMLDSLASSAPAGAAEEGQQEEEQSEWVESEEEDQSVEPQENFGKRPLPSSFSFS